MNSKKHKPLITAAAVLIALAASVFQNVFAFDINENSQEHYELEQQASEYEQQLDDTEKEIADKEAESKKLQQQISDLSKKITQSNNKIKTLNNEIDEKQKEIDEKLKAVEDRLNALRVRLRTIYIQGDTTSLEVILGAKDFSDFMDKAELVKNLSDYDNRLIQSLQSEMEVISQEQKKLRSDKEAIEKEKTNLENNKNKINKLNEDNTKLIQELKSTKTTLEDEIKQNDERQKVLEDALAEYNKELSEQLKQKRQQEKLAKQQQKSQQIQKKLAEQQQRDSQNPEIVVPATEDDKFLWPCPGHTNLTSTFEEWRGANNHGALDIADGDVYAAKVIACYKGTVISTNTDCTHDYGKYESCGCGGGYGNYVMIDHGGGKVSIYGHLSAVSVVAGQEVATGQLIGYVGSTGYSTGPHLHFELQLDGVRYDPLTEYE